MDSGVERGSQSSGGYRLGFRAQDPCSMAQIRQSGNSCAIWNRDGAKRAKWELAWRKAAKVGTAKRPKWEPSWAVARAYHSTCAFAKGSSTVLASRPEPSSPRVPTLARSRHLDSFSRTISHFARFAARGDAPSRSHLVGFQDSWNRPQLAPW